MTQSADHAINIARSVMLIELEKFHGVVIFATNFVQNYDTAFVRRLLHFVRFDLPDIECRKQIFASHLPHELPRTEDVSIDSLAEITEGFSGGDIRNIVLKAVARAAMEPNEDAHKKATLHHFTQAIQEIREVHQVMMLSQTQERVYSGV